MTADEEVELAQKIKAGDQAALERLTKANYEVCCFCCKTIPESRFNAA
ncbi:MAG: hypothetical protein MZV63_05870 [Marinilabiliales bacterium]|nr:hypothetical protein [Marinilabiliales bacterium]